ncbi:hypothetical protein Golax_005358, partial [Gossypium laxum]|nr:hypothetical protein [Gossypium laxum]
ESEYNLVSIPWPEYQYSGCSYRYLAKGSLGDLLTLSDCTTWLTQLSTLKAFPQYVVAWVCILGLFGALYKMILLQEIQSLIGKVVKSDFQMEKDLGASSHGLRCKFEHLRDVCPHVSLEKGMEGDGEILHGNKSSD